VDWWLIGVAGVAGIIILTLFNIYWRSLSETRALTTYLLAVTLHEAVYVAQRENLAKFIMTIEPKDRIDLKTQVSLRTHAMVQLAEHQMYPMVIERLWKLRTGELKL
jgi:hypothetical protein